MLNSSPIACHYHLIYVDVYCVCTTSFLCPGRFCILIYVFFLNASLTTENAVVGHMCPGGL